MRIWTAALAGALLLAGCGSPSPEPGSTTGTPTSSTLTASPTPTTADPSPTSQPTASSTPTPPPEPGTVAPAWLGTRPLPLTATGYGEQRPTPPELRNRRFTLPDHLDPLPGTGFASRISSPAPDRVVARSTWEPGCPVARADLAWVRVTFRGFDGERHTGELLVHASAADDLVQVFDRLWEADFPLEELRITRADELDVPPTGDGNNTESLVCRAVTGGSSFSRHAYGLAIDLNPFQNPYAKDGVVLPELASAYVDRGRVRPGMILPDDPVVRAFAEIGWGWGGTWRSLKDHQHFSDNNT